MSENLTKQGTQETEPEDGVQVESEESKEPESVEDTILASMEELGDKVDESEKDQQLQGDEGQKQEEPVDKTTRDAAKDSGKGKKRGRRGKRRETVEAADLGTEAEGEQEPEPAKLEPPARWPVEKKEWFNKQPREAQEEIARGWTEIEGNTTKLWQDLRRREQQYGEIEQIVNHYLPNWHLKGVTAPQAIAELCAAQDAIQKDPVSAYSMMLERSGITPEHITQFRQQGGVQTQPQSQVQTQGQTTGLTKGELLSILDKRDQTRASQSAVNNAATEIDQVRRQTTPEGNYLYPELWDADYLNYRVKPLVEGFRKTQPNVSWGELAKRAVHTLRIADGQATGSPSPNSPRLPNKQDEIARARAASVSVRGRGNGMISNQAKPKPGESIEDSILASMDALSS